MDIIKKEMTCPDCKETWFFRFARVGQEDEHICGCWDHYVATLKNENDIDVNVVPFPNGNHIINSIKNLWYKIKKIINDC